MTLREIRAALELLEGELATARDLVKADNPTDCADVLEVLAQAESMLAEARILLSELRR